MSESDIECIDLISPSPSPGPHEASASGVKKEGASTTKQVLYVGDDSDDSDTPVEVPPPKKQRVEQQPSSSSAADDGECVFVSETGVNPLIDYPHARWHCQAKPRTSHSLDSYCPKCHCVICDTNPDQCNDWGAHCAADPNDLDVKKKRAAYQQAGGTPANLCQLKHLLQVYPTEKTVALSGDVCLKTYQRQCLSWMCDIEENGFQTDRLFESTLVDLSDPCLPPKFHGGVLGIEMGMGKSLVIVALCVLRPMQTMIVAPSLTRVQWVKHFQDHTSLSVMSVYCDSQSRIEAKLLEADVVVINSSSHLIDSLKTRVRRIVIDESHEMGKPRSGVFQFVHNLESYSNVKHTWLVSGTPFGSSEKISDPAFRRQVNILMHRMRWKLKDDATTADVKALVMRMEKAQSYTQADGISTSFMPIAEVEIKMLKVGLNERERELYNIAACMDGWTDAKFSIKNKKNTDEIANELDIRFALRRLILGERISEFQAEAKKRLDSYFYVSDSEPPDLSFAKADRMLARIELCCKELADCSSKIDAVLDEIAFLRSRDPLFKAVVITESEGAGQLIKKRLGIKVGVMQRSKGRTSVREQRELIKFQEGKYEILVCSFESVRIGTNLDQAGAIYFVDISIVDSEYKQAMARISRCGTKHSQLTATFVVVEETLSKAIYDYHEDRRAGKSIEEAAMRFEEDDPHEYSEPRFFHKVVLGRPFEGMTFACQKLPDMLLSDIMSPDMPIDEMFTAICDSDRSTDDYQVSITFKKDKRPALYEKATQIVVTGKTDSAFRLVFEVDDKGDDFDVSQLDVLVTNITLNAAGAKILSSIDNWHRNSASVPVTLQMILKNGMRFPLYDDIQVIKAKCCSCKWCGWRSVGEYTVPFVGAAPIVEDTTTQTLIPNEKLLTVSHKYGTLHASFLIGYEGKKKMFKGYGFAKSNRLFTESFMQAREDLKRMGFVPRELRYNLLTRNFFEARPEIYKKVLVRITEASLHDTIRFQHKGWSYEAFIREMVPVGLDWYAVAYVVDGEPHDGTILIDTHTLVDMRRVAKVSADALSIKDIIRLLQSDSDKTARLKVILQSRDITDADKLQQAAALV